MIGAETDPLTLRSMLFGGDDGNEIIRSLQNEDASSGVSRTLSLLPPGLEAASADHIGDAIGGLLEFPIVKVLALGWQKHDRLMAAARRSIEDPSAVEIVDLETHTIRSIHEPRLQVFVGEVLVSVITLQVALGVEVHALQAVIQAGRIVAFASGRADLKADLSCDGVKMRSASTAVDLHLQLWLDGGLELVAPVPPTPPINPPTGVTAP